MSVQETAIRNQLSDIYRSLSKGEQAYARNCADRVLGELSRRDVAGAIETLETYPWPTATLQAAAAQSVAFLESLT